MPDFGEESDSVTLELTDREVRILYGCIVEAKEALSAAEFRARVGVAALEASSLLAPLKLVATRSR